MTTSSSSSFVASARRESILDCDKECEEQPCSGGLNDPSRCFSRSNGGKQFTPWVVVTLCLLCGWTYNTTMKGYDTDKSPRNLKWTAVSPHSMVSPVLVSRTHQEDDDDDDDDSYCSDGKYGKRTLKLAYERPMASLFSLDDTYHHYEHKFETSGVIVVNDTGYAICDSSWTLYQFGLDLQPRDSVSNARFERTDPQQQATSTSSDDEEEEESDYEALAYLDGTFYLVRESIEIQQDSYHAIIEEVVLNPYNNVPGKPRNYTLRRQCATELEFEGDSKGLEGILAVRDLQGEVVLMSLCEGNHCSETYKHDRGNGRIVIMKQSVTDGDGDCQWDTIRTLEIPSSANFADYSAMSLYDRDNFLAITSQEDSQLWVGRLLGKQPDTGLWDVDNIQFDDGIGEVFDFPKDHDCSTIYCNIEGIHWVNGGTLLAASDKMKKKGKQDFRCRDKDQSIHFFTLP